MKNLKKKCEKINSFRRLDNIDLQIGHVPGYDESMEGEAIRDQTEYGKSNIKSGISKREHMGTTSDSFTRRSD